MNFSSITFLFYYLPVTLATLLLTHQICRRLKSEKITANLINGLLLTLSLIFYTWGEGKYVIILLASLILTFICGILINSSPRKARVPITAIGIAINVGLLCYYKYTNFGIESTNSLLNALGLEYDIAARTIILPLGISFYTFQSISYLIDIYRKHNNPTKNFVTFGCYITFFPQLVAGPIVRFADIQEDMRKRRINIEGISSGAVRFIVGLSKKVLIANPTGELADALFAAQPESIGGLGCWLAAVCYSIQILFDFSGYSDMAIGLARILGIDIPENFDAPYRSKSLREFWRRWHISLSTWFRDYLFIPLGGSRSGKLRTALNLTIVFFVCGLWHGASLNFVLWGLLHGLFIGLEHAFPTKLKQRLKSIKLSAILGRIYTIFVVLSAWILFRSESTSHAFDIFGQMYLGLPLPSKSSLPIEFYSLEIQIALAAGIFISFFPRKLHYETSRESMPASIFVKAGSLALLMLCMIYVGISTHNPFIYFRF